MLIRLKNEFLMYSYRHDVRWIFFTVSSTPRMMRTWQSVVPSFYYVPLMQSCSCQKRNLLGPIQSSVFNIMGSRTRILIPFLVDNFKTYLAWPHVHIFGNLASIDMILNFKKRGPFSGKVQHVRPSLCGFPNFTHSILLLDLRPSSSWLPSREEIKPTCSW